MAGSEHPSSTGNKFELLVQSVTDYAIYMLDLQGRVTSWNAGARRFKGYEPDEIIGEHFSRFYTAEERAKEIPRIALETAEREGRFEAEGWRVRKDGTTFWANVVIDPVRDNAGNLIGYAKVTRDLTERRAAEQELRASEERFRMLVQSVTDYAIYLLDPDGRVSSWNAGAERFKGYTADEIMGEHFSRFYTDEDRAAEIPRIALETAASEGRFETEGWRLRKDGSRFWASVIIDSIRNDDGELIGFAKVTRDLTEKRGIEEQLRQSQKMEAVGQLTGGLAHDFNNLLTGIGGSLEMMQVRMAQGRTGDFDRYLLAAQGAVKRAAALTHRLLAFSRRQPLDPRPTNINRLINDLQDLIQRTVGPSVRVEVVGAGGLWPTLVDPNQLENAILNLSINARDAMPDGGRLTIETANKWLDERTARQQDLPVGQYVSICVSDTGTGMAPDIVAKAFEPFFTTKPLGQGTGLGLSMIYGFARQSGGQVRIYSEVGQGTTMCIYLPRHDEEAVSEDEANSSMSSEPVGDGEVVLLIDDEPTIRMLAGEVLTEAGYAVIEAPDGPTGLRILESNARIDLLITDVGLPGGMNGRQVADAARVSRPDLKVLFITGYAENAVVGGGRLEKGMFLLSKPFQVELLPSRVQEIIRR
ncbi:PAS domain-containing sensor histidine kinase [Sphingomonas bacterium]|uniref:hybrid sensor histidine kinase/response regulator n=1 Tax=Sphingomonas bacterium TaxID=1895847 RepID=UPI002601AB15|nr:PAS domain-containing sensor histidine kinase [Sphingomonas bacterium]MDB5679058.1 sensor protein [Sphingomonas bacterium]MDB5712311.1 sensor protein [Sphingomonas bacterium]